MIFVWMDKNNLLVYLTWYILMPYLFLYLKLILLKLKSYGLQVGPKLSKYPKNMTYFHYIPKFSIDLTVKWVENCHKSCGLNVLRAWHVEIMHFVCIGGNVGGIFKKHCGILKYWKITIPLSFFETFKQTMTHILN